MDRFIDDLTDDIKQVPCGLKSNMDRFIATTQAITIRVIPRFKIQYG